MRSTAGATTTSTSPWTSSCRPPTIVDASRDQDWSAATHRGLTVDSLRRDFPGYVESGARSIRAEVILTTRAELIESEFGRSIHEERILDQRSNASYRGRIARNASFLIEYMFMLAVSPTVEIESLPVRMWGRYLPDVFSLAVWRLFGIKGDSALGGGTLMPANYAAMAEAGVIVYLKASVDQLFLRLQKKGDRPVLRGDDGEALGPEQLRARIE